MLAKPYEALPPPNVEVLVAPNDTLLPPNDGALLDPNVRPEPNEGVLPVVKEDVNPSSIYISKKVEVPAKPTERLLPAPNVGVVPDSGSGVLLEENWTEVPLLLRRKEGRLDEFNELGAVKPNKLPEAPEAEANKVDPNKERLVFPHKELLENEDVGSTELERDGELAELPNTNSPEVVVVAFSMRSH